MLIFVLLYDCTVFLSFILYVAHDCKSLCKSVVAAVYDSSVLQKCGLSVLQGYLPLLCQAQKAHTHTHIFTKPQLT